MPENDPTRIRLPRWLAFLFVGSVTVVFALWFWLLVRIVATALGYRRLLPTHDEIIVPWLPITTGIYLFTKIFAANYVRRAKKRAQSL